MLFKTFTKVCLCSYSSLGWLIVISSRFATVSWLLRNNFFVVGLMLNFSPFHFTFTTISRDSEKSDWHPECILAQVKNLGLVYFSNIIALFSPPALELQPIFQNVSIPHGLQRCVCIQKKKTFTLHSFWSWRAGDLFMHAFSHIHFSILWKVVTDITLCCNHMRNKRSFIKIDPLAFWLR